VAKMKAANAVGPSREERIKRLIALTNLDRKEAEMHIDMVDGKSVGDLKVLTQKKTIERG
jgi:hypothetical protein